MTHSGRSLPGYSGETLATLDPVALTGILVRDEDRVPRNLIDECARRADQMAQCLGEAARRIRVLAMNARPAGEHFRTLASATLEHSQVGPVEHREGRRLACDSAPEKGRGCPAWRGKRRVLE